MIQITIGLIGMSLILLAFLLGEFFNKCNPNTLTYNLINLIGAGILVYYSYLISSWPFLILNFVWSLVALIKLIKISWFNYFL
jgi:uncharacterized protein YqhQ